MKVVQPGLQVIVKRITGVSLLGFASISLSVAVIKSALIPEQLHWIAAAGPVLVTIAIVVVCQQNGVSRSRLPKPLSVVAVTSLIGLIVLHSTFVIEIPINSIPINYLIGWGMTPWATEALQNCLGASQMRGAPIDPKALFTCAGPDTIPIVYGRSYQFIYTFYSLFYLSLVASFASIVTAAVMKQPQDHSKD